MTADRKDCAPVYPEWHAVLPVAVAAAGVLFFDERGQVMLVRTTYKDDWDIPGGVIELDQGETPLQAARREVAEELDLDVPIGRLLSVDVVPASADRRALIAFIFDGGMLDADDIGRIRFPDKEIAEFRFCRPEHVGELALPSLYRRVLSSVAARASAGAPFFLKHGR